MNSIPNSNIGVITTCSPTYFEALLWWRRAVSATGLPHICFDSGLTPKQRQVFQREGGKLMDYPNFPQVENREMWAKPLLFKKAPFNQCLWLDVDTLVLGSLVPVIQHLAAKPFVTIDMLGAYATPNKPELYDLEQVGRPINTACTVNTGVVGLDKTRDGELLNWWEYLMRRAVSDKRVHDAINWSDQGAFIWALHKLGRFDCINCDYLWNYVAGGKLAGTTVHRKQYSNSPTFLEEVRADHPGVSIVHWPARPKYWENWAPSA